MSTEIQNEENLAAHGSNNPLRKALAMAEHREQTARIENNRLRAELAEATELLKKCQPELADRRLWEQRYNEQTKLASRAIEERDSLRSQLLEWQAACERKDEALNELVQHIVDRGAFKPAQETIDKGLAALSTQPAEALALHVAPLMEALEEVLSSAHPNQVEHSAMFYAWKDAYAALAEFRAKHPTKSTTP